MDTGSHARVMTTNERKRVAPGFPEPTERAARSTPATRGELATLWVDGPGATFNIGLVCRFEPGPFAQPDGAVDVEAVRTVLARRAASVPTLRRRLVAGRRPVWVDGPLYPEQHVRRADLADGVELLDWCADRILEPLDRTRPLWRADVVAVAGGGFALLLVAHHVLTDGRKGVAVLRALLDDPWDGDLAPVAAHPDRPRPAAPTGWRHRWRQLRNAIGDLRGRAPVTSLSHPVGSERRVAVVFADLAGLREAEDAFGATVNDVLLAAVTAGLRKVLLSRGEAVAGLEMRASVPVSSGAADQPEGMLLLALPVGEEDPVRRLTTIAARTTALKRRLRSGGGTVFDVLRLPTPLARAAVRWLQHIAARGINLFVTDVPGPPKPLFLAGARLLSAVPVAPLTRNVPLGVAALSYAGTLYAAVNADAAVADLVVLSDAMEHEFATLVAEARRYATGVKER
jgi:diacylglycerol O-acyltransferase